MPSTWFCLPTAGYHNSVAPISVHLPPHCIPGTSTVGIRYKSYTSLTSWLWRTRDTPQAHGRVEITPISIHQARPCITNDHLCVLLNLLNPLLLQTLMLYLLRHNLAQAPNLFRDHLRPNGGNLAYLNAAKHYPLLRATQLVW